MASANNKRSAPRRSGLNALKQIAQGTDLDKYFSPTEISQLAKTHPELRFKIRETGVFKRHQNKWLSDKNKLFDAIEQDDVKAVFKLLKANPRLVNARDAQGQTPMMLAAGGSMIDQIWRFEPDVTAIDHAGRTIFHHYLYDDNGLVGALIINYKKTKNYNAGALKHLLFKQVDHEGYTVFDLAREMGEEDEFIGEQM